jgi:hypothetical protein
MILVIKKPRKKTAEKSGAKNNSGNKRHGKVANRNGTGKLLRNSIVTQALLIIKKMKMQ